MRLLACLIVCAASVGCGEDSEKQPNTGSGGTGASASGGTGGSAGSGGNAGALVGGSAGAGAGPSGAYEGFGAVTEGHASCADTPTEVAVTTLADSGPGSLREALSGGCRRIVFSVGGTILLESDLNLPHSFVTIDGCTAPAPGISIDQPNQISTTIEASGSVGPAHDIIVRCLRVDGKATVHENAGDIWGLDGEAAAVYNIIIDHVTGIASSDGVFDVWGDVHDVTISWNVIRDTVTAHHLSTGDLTQSRQRISFHHNLFARNNERQIRLRHDTQSIDYVNNLIYGWGWFESGGRGLNVAYDAGETNPSLNVVGNVFHYVTGLASTEGDAIDWARGADEGTLYFEDNVLPAGEADGVSNGAALAIPAFAQVTTHPASSLLTTVVPFVGTQYPTPEEQQLVSDVIAAIQ